LADTQNWLVDPLFGGTVQNGRHLVELLAATSTGIRLVCR
jgi:hypothetical protein